MFSFSSLIGQSYLNFAFFVADRVFYNKVEFTEFEPILLQKDTFRPPDSMKNMPDFR